MLSRGSEGRGWDVGELGMRPIDTLPVMKQGLMEGERLCGYFQHQFDGRGLCEGNGLRWFDGMV